jgi:hypothetical protein
MRHPRDSSTSQERYGLVVVENPRGLVIEANPWRPAVGTSAWAAPDPRARAERFVVAGFVLAYLATFGGFALWAVRWLIAG